MRAALQRGAARICRNRVAAENRKDPSSAAEVDEVQLIILAGGRNSRIQTKKALLSVGGKPIIERIVERLRPIVEGCTLVTGDPEAFAFLGLASTADRYPGKGPLGGLEAGLTASPEELNLVVACDLPFVSLELAGYLAREAEEHPEADAVVPSWEKGQEPLFAVYRRRVAAVLAERLQLGDLRLGRLSQVLNIRQAEVGQWASARGIDLRRAFWNVNTWAEWREAEGAAQAETGVGAGGTTLPPVVAVVGWQDSGKTTLTSALIRGLSRAGLRVAVVKHDPHGHETDVPGKDTYLHRQAGAVITALAGPGLLTTWRPQAQPPTLKSVVEGLPPVDFVLAEGWKGEDVPRLVVARQTPSAPPEGLASLMQGEVLAVVDGASTEEEVAALVERLMRRFGLGGAPR